MPKPNIMSQLQAQVGLSRLGGAASLGSTPVSTSPGAKFSGMENAMLKKLKPNPVKMTPGKKGKQYKKQAREGESQEQE